MQTWSEVIAPWLAASRPTLEVGIAVLLRASLPLGLALVVWRFACALHPRSRRSIYTACMSATLLVILITILPGGNSTSIWTISLPGAVDASKGMGQKYSFEESALSHVVRNVSLAHMPTSAGEETFRSAASQSAAMPSMDAAVSRTPPHDLSPLYAALLTIWLCGVFGSFVWILIGQLLAVQLCRRATVISGGALIEDLTELCCAEGASAPGLLRSSEATGPFVTGVLRTAIVLPDRLIDSVDRATMRAILAHEVHHIAARDIEWTLVSRILCALLWPNPLVWLLLRHWRDSSEEACDAAAIANSSAPQSYARCLIDIAESLAGYSPRAGMEIGMAGSRSRLARRIERILELRERKLVEMSSMATKGVVCLFGAVLLLTCKMIAAQSPAPLAATSPPPHTSPSEQSADSDSVSPDRSSQSKRSRREKELYRKEIEAARRELDRRGAELKRPRAERERAQEEIAALQERIAAIKREARARERMDRGDEAQAEASDAAKRAEEVQAERLTFQALGDRVKESAAAARSEERAAAEADRAKRDSADQRPRDLNAQGAAQATAEEASQAHDRAQKADRQAKEERRASASGRAPSADVLAQDLTNRDAALSELRKKYPEGQPKSAQAEGALRQLRDLLLQTNQSDANRSQDLAAKLQAERAESKLRTLQNQDVLVNERQLREKLRALDQSAAKARDILGRADFEADKRQLSAARAKLLEENGYRVKRAQMDAARKRLLEANGYAAKATRLASADQDKLRAENDELKSQLAKLKAEVESLKREREHAARDK